MKNWIHPIHKDTPFFTSNKNFTKIAADRVQGSNKSMHNVLLLATGTYGCGILIQDLCILMFALWLPSNPSFITGFCLVPLLLDKGVIFKILEDGSNAFIISETHLSNGSAPIHSMKLDSEKVVNHWTVCKQKQHPFWLFRMCHFLLHGCCFCVQRKLFVGYPGQLSVLDLQRCQDYNDSCEECVLSRDPYCAWTERGCTSQTEYAFISFY